jgi:hypothetical protein
MPFTETGVPSGVFKKRVQDILSRLGRGHTTLKI